MEKIIKDVLLHIIYRKEDLRAQTERGADLTPPEEFLQARALNAKAGETFKAHSHFPQDRSTDLTQESIVVIEGSVKVVYFDTEGNVLGETILKTGDCFVTLRGGHKFEILEEGTLFYEYKNGPYNGLTKDKKFIEEN